MGSSAMNDPETSKQKWTSILMNKGTHFDYISKMPWNEAFVKC